jgi:hypothetical protein
MEDDCLSTIAETQKQILALRRDASAHSDPTTQDIYLTIADMLEQFAREFDRTVE